MPVGQRRARSRFSAILFLPLLFSSRLQVYPLAHLFIPVLNRSGHVYQTRSQSLACFRN